MTARACASEMEPQTKEPLVFYTWSHHRSPGPCCTRGQQFTASCWGSHPQGWTLSWHCSCTPSHCTKALLSCHQARDIFQSLDTTELVRQVSDARNHRSCVHTAKNSKTRDAVLNLKETQCKCFNQSFQVFFLGVDNTNKDNVQLSTSLDYISGEYLPLGCWGGNRGAMLSTLSLSCIWKGSLQSTRFLFLISFFSRNERREADFKSQKYSLAKVCLRNSVKIYALCTKVCKLSWKQVVLFWTVVSGKKNKRKE